MVNYAIRQLVFVRGFCKWSFGTVNLNNIDIYEKNNNLDIDMLM